jgi:hypothetical protein
LATSCGLEELAEKARTATLPPLSSAGPAKHAGSMGDLLGGLWDRFRAFHAETVEASERLWLLQNPWQEDLLHWGADGSLHGSQVPASARRPSTTRSGWCPGLRLAGQG